LRLRFVLVVTMPPSVLDTLRRREPEVDLGSQQVFLASEGGAEAPPDGRSRAAAGLLRTIGVDLSASEAYTACVTLEWHRGGALVGQPLVGIGREELAVYLAGGDWIGIDAPFGWPQPMVDAIHGYASEAAWSELDKESFRYRASDLHLRDQVLEQAGEKFTPMSVASDTLAMTACRTAQLREDGFASSGRRFDRAGADRILEVHPRAALLLWGLNHKGYKTSRDPSRHEAEATAREDLLSVIGAQAPWLRWAPGAHQACLDSADALDALLAALIARAAALGWTTPPPPELLDLARLEGWAHLPPPESLPLLAAGG
jgi:hypothetical protein